MDTSQYNTGTYMYILDTLFGPNKMTTHLVKSNIVITRAFPDTNNDIPTLPKRPDITFHI